MKIKAGTRYLTRDGRVTGPIDAAFSRLKWEAKLPDGQTIFWFRGGVYGGGWSEHPLDLVAEYQEPGDD